MIRKIILTFTILIVFTSFFTGCTNNSNVNSTSFNKDVENSIDITTKDTFTILTDEIAFNWNNPVAKVLTEKTGVILKPKLIIGDATDITALMISSGEYTDIVKNTGNSMQMFLEAKSYIQLDDLIEKYGKEIKNFYADQYKTLRYSTDDPHIYSFGIGASLVAEPEIGYAWDAPFFISSEALEYSQHPEVKTPNDFEKVINDFITANPKMPDGETDRIGISLLTSDGYRFQNSILKPISAMNGLTFDGGYLLDENNQKIESILTSEILKDGLKWYNEMWNDGIIDPESFTQSYDIYQSKIASGRCIGVIDPFYEFFDAYTQGKVQNEDLAYMFFPILKDPDNMTWNISNPVSTAKIGGFSITTACKKPEKFVNLMNYLASEEGQILTECGILGENYTIVDNMRVQDEDDRVAHAKNSAEYISVTGVKLYARSSGQWLHQPLGYKTSNGQILNFNDVNNASDVFSQAEQSILSKYGFEHYTDIAPKSNDFVSSKYGALTTLPTGFTEESTVAKFEVDNLRLPYFSKLIQAKDDAQFDALWDEFQQEIIDAGIDVVLDEINNSYLDRIELWNMP